MGNVVAALAYGVQRIKYGMLEAIDKLLKLSIHNGLMTTTAKLVVFDPLISLSIEST